MEGPYDGELAGFPHEEGVSSQIDPAHIERFRGYRGEGSTGDPESSPPPINVWFIGDENDRSAQESSGEFKEVIAKHNQGSRIGGRHVSFIGTSYRELRHEIEFAYTRSNAEARHFPEIAIIYPSARLGNDYSSEHIDGLRRAYLNMELAPFDEITKATEEYHKRALYGIHAQYHAYDDIIDPAADLLDVLEEQVFSATYNETYRKKRELNATTLIDFGFGRLFLDENQSMEPVLRTVWAYLNDHDETRLLALLSDSELQKAYDEMCRYDLESADEDYESIRHLAPETLGGFQGWRDYREYRRRLARASKKLDFNGMKERMRERYLLLLKEGAEKIGAAVIENNDRLHRDLRLIRPIVVSVSENSSFQRHAIEHGANMIPENLDGDDVEQMIILAEKMRSSKASLEREHTQRTKRMFYRENERELGDRSELTADTEQELVILEGVFQREGTKEVLDVGCGEGRIIGPLAKSGYRMHGIEANAAFRKKAGVELSDPGAVVEGDIIDYRNSVPAEKYDAVTYTWHTILEAYGIGNTMQTLVSAWRALKPGGVLVFDQPTRENPGMEDGWYGDKEHRRYLAYLMDHEELCFVLRMAGFETPEIISWITKPTALYPGGMKKWTVVARKPEKKNPASDHEVEGHAQSHS